LRYITIVRIWFLCHNVFYGANQLVPTIYLFPLGKMLLLMAWKDSQEELNSESKLREFFLLTHPIFVTNQSISPGFQSIWHHMFILFLAKIIVILLSWNKLNMGNAFVNMTEQLAQSNSEYSLSFCLPWINNSEI